MPSLLPVRVLQNQVVFADEYVLIIKLVIVSIETRMRQVVEKVGREKPLQHMRTMLGRRQPPIFVTSSIVLLLLAEKPAHGYALFKEMCDMGVYDDAVDPSAVYPTLKALEEEGFVTAEPVEGSSGPPRKVFHITKGGLRALNDFVEGHLRIMASDIEYFQNRYDAIQEKKPSRGEKAGGTVADRQDRNGGPIH